MSFFQRIDRICEYIGVLQTLFIAGYFLFLWLFATEADAYVVYSMAILMGFEFIMVHSGVIMTFLSKTYSILLFFPFYGLFAWGFNKMLDDGDNTVMILYLTTVLNRMRFAFFNADENMKNRAVMTSVISVMIYFFLLFLVCFGSSLVPHFSLGESFTNSAAYAAVQKVGGMFPEEPYVPICLGFLYYLLLSYVSFKMIRNPGFIKAPEVTKK